jgi:hypothetical protein
MTQVPLPEHHDVVEGLPEKRKPARCQRKTVSGRRIVSALRTFGNNWQSQPSTNLSAALNIGRDGLPRRSTMICCRSTRSSASSARSRSEQIGDQAEN